MTKGIVAIVLGWGCIVVAALVYPWIGFVGYAGFAVLCPQWNWRWGMPDIDFQKYIAGATLVGFLLSGVNLRTVPKAVQLSLLGLLAYLLLVFISSFQSISPTRTQDYWDITWKIVLMSTVGLFLINTERKLAWLGWTVVISQGWNAFNINQIYLERGYINVNYFSWNFLDNNTYSISSLPIAAISFSILMTYKETMWRALAGLILVLQMHQIMILQSRGTMIGGVIMILLGLLFMPKNRITISMAFITGILGVVLAGPSVIEEFTSSFSPEGERDSSAESRFFLWKAGARIMVDYPLLGVGPWAGESIVPKYYEGDLGGMTTKALHNLFFEVGTGSGVISLAGYLLFFATPWFSHFWRRKEINQLHSRELTCVNLAVLCGIPGYWVASMFSSGALIESPYLLTIYGLASLRTQLLMQVDVGGQHHDHLSYGDWAAETEFPGSSLESGR